MKKIRGSLLLSVLAISICGCDFSFGNSEASNSISTNPPSNSISESNSASLSTSSSTSPSTSIEDDKTILDYNTTAKNEAFKKRGYTPLFKDSNFANGFRITKTDTAAEGGPYHSEYLRHYSETSLKTPSWTMCQWGSKYDFYQNYNEVSSADNLEFTYTSKGGKNIAGSFVPAKKLSFNSKTGSVYLECNAEVEYETPRGGSDPWVHVLLEQDFGDNLVNVNACESLIMEAQFEIKKFEDKMGSDFNAGLHAAQVVWYVTLQNRNRESADYGKYIWFGINLWDNRSAGQVTNLYAQLDGGTSSFIYNPSSRLYYADNNFRLPEVNQKITASLDISDIARSAYNLAIQRGFLGTTQYEDLYVGGMNFGFEVPGTYNIGVEWDDIGVYYKLK